jgi:hypothetical protein
LTVAWTAVGAEAWPGGQVGGTTLSGLRDRDAEFVELTAEPERHQRLADALPGEQPLAAGVGGSTGAEARLFAGAL